MSPYVSWELVLFQGMGVEFKGEITSNYSRGVKWQQGVTFLAAKIYVQNKHIGNKSKTKTIKPKQLKTLI